MSLHWVKLWLDVLDDPKMGRLSDTLFRRTVELILLAGRQDEDGFLPALDVIAWALRCDEEQLETELFTLSQVGILNQEDGRWKVTNFSRRQSKVDGAARTRAWRQRSKARAEAETAQEPPLGSPPVTETRRCGDDTVTKSHPDSDSESDSEAEKKQKQTRPLPHPARAMSVFTEVTGMLAVPGGERSEALADIETLMAHHGDDAADYLRPFWDEWRARKYSKSNTAWLTEWAVAGEIPAQKGRPIRAGPAQAAALAALDELEEKQKS